MKKPLFYLLALLLALTAQFVWANGRLAVTADRLQAVNRYWAQQPEAAILTLTSEETADEREILRVHLRLVEQVLRSRPVTHLSTSQQQNRAQHLDHLHQYWLTEGLPVNTTHSYRLPIFIDGQDNFCAVGYLLKLSGNERIAREIAATQRYAYVPEIAHPDLQDWATASGLTLEELAWIQPGYPVSVNASSLQGGTNGHILDMITDPQTGIVYASGTFTEAGGQNTFSNVAAWMPGFAGYTWVSLGSGLGSPVRSLCMYQGVLFAGGNDMLPTGASNSVAYWNGSNWTTPGPLVGPVTKLFTWHDSLYAAIDISPSLPPTGNHQLFCLTQWGWQLRGSFNGPVLAAVPYQNEVILGGEFTTAGGVSAQHVVRYNGSQFSPLGGGTPLPVKALEVHQDTLYAGGDFSSPIDTTTIFGLAHWTGNQWKNDLIPFGSGMLVPGTRINKLISVSDHLVAGGTFEAYTMTTYGRNLASLERITGTNTGYLNPLALVDSAVNAVTLLGPDLFIGGEFTSVLGGGPDIRHAASFSVAHLLSTEQPLVKAEAIGAYPNPSQGTLHLNLNTPADEIQLLDLLGRPVYVGKASLNQTLDLSGLAAGSYVLQARLKGNLVGIQQVVLQ
jgi:hypothetical protein